MRRRVAITGIGAVSPHGVGAKALYDGWCAGVCAIGEDGFGRATAFDPKDHLEKKEIRRSDRFTQFALVAAREAMEQAGWLEDGLPIDPDRIGSVIGTGFGGVATLEAQTAKFVRNEPGLSPLGISLVMPNAAPGMIALKYGLHGPAHGVVSACAAGSDGVGTAARLIATGDADAMVAGGTDAPLAGVAITLTKQAGALSRTGIPRPFDIRRDGLVLGEAAGMLVLEEYETAEARGATIIGEILGYGASADAHHMTAPSPDGSGAALAIKAALRDAGVQPEQVVYVNAHGTSTQLNDAMETKAIKQALGDHAMKIPVSSTKSVIGHTLGGAGGTEAVVTTMALRDRIAPPTVGLEQQDPELDLNYVPGKSQPLPEFDGVTNGRAIALSNSFGFGGHNAVLCLAA